MEPPEQAGSRRAAGAASGAEAGLAAAPPLLLFVRQAGGELRPVEVEPMATVADVLAAMGNPRMVLSYQGERLDPQATLADAGVCNQAVLEGGREPVRVESVPAGGRSHHSEAMGLHLLRYGSLEQPSGLAFGLQAKHGGVSVTTLGVSLYVHRRRTTSVQVYCAREGLSVPHGKDLEPSDWTQCADCRVPDAAGHPPEPVQLDMPVLLDGTVLLDAPVLHAPVQLDAPVHIPADGPRYFYIFVKDATVAYTTGPADLRTVENDEIFSVGGRFMEGKWEARRTSSDQPFHYLGYVEYV